MKRAEQVQAAIDAGELAGPLAGVPIAVKDNICTKDVKTTCASRILSNFVPSYSAEAVSYTHLFCQADERPAFRDRRRRRDFCESVQSGGF